MTGPGLDVTSRIAPPHLDPAATNAAAHALRISITSSIAELAALLGERNRGRGLMRRRINRPPRGCILFLPRLLFPSSGETLRESPRRDPMTGTQTVRLPTGARVGRRHQPSERPAFARGLRIGPLDNGKEFSDLVLKRSPSAAAATRVTTSKSGGHGSRQGRALASPRWRRNAVAIAVSGHVRLLRAVERDRRGSDLEKPSCPRLGARSRSFARSARSWPAANAPWGCPS